MSAAISWGAADFGGGYFTRRLPLMGVLLVTQVVGMGAALSIALMRGESVPDPSDAAWSLGAAACGLVGVAALYRGLAVGRMGVVAPVAGIVCAVVPATVGFVSEGLPSPLTLAGIGAGLLAVVLVTQAPHDGRAGRPSGWTWGLLAGIGLGTLSVALSRLHSESVFAPLAAIRALQVAVLFGTAVAFRQAWRLPPTDLPRLAFVGVLDMGGNALFIAAAHAGALATAAVLSSLYPVTTVLLAVALLRERLTHSHLAGIGLTAAAIALLAAGSTVGH